MIAIVALTEKGKKIALKIKKHLPNSRIYLPAKLGKDTDSDLLFEESLRDLTGKLFKEYEKIIFCMALGIVVRVIAPYLQDKFSDPAVVVVDEGGRFAISTLCGHEGRANELSYLVAGIIDGEPVVTTSSESNKSIIIGIGCKKGEKEEHIIVAISSALKKSGLNLSQVRQLATVDFKKSEKGLKDASNKIGIPIRFVSYNEIKNFAGEYNRSCFVKKKIDIEGVCEPCALLAGRKTKLILPRTKINGVMVAIAEENCM
jgi:cobalt-precorrin 5A hydrolase